MEVSVKLEALKSLIASKLLLERLEGAGIDNWEGYNQVNQPTSAEVDLAVYYYVDVVY